MNKHRDSKDYFHDVVGAYPDHNREGQGFVPSERPDQLTLQQRLAAEYRVDGLGKPEFNERFTTMENYFEVGMRFEMRGNLLLAAVTFAADYVARGCVWHPIRNHGRSRFV